MIHFSNRVKIFFVVGLFFLFGLSNITQAQLGRGFDPQDPTQAGVLTNIRWSEDSNYLEYGNKGKRYRLDVNTLSVEEIGEQKPEDRSELFRRYRPPAIKVGNREINSPGRGRQYMTEVSPDSVWFADCKDWNVVLENVKTGDTIPVTTEGHRKFRYGTANWVYGEEIGVRHGMWWTPDSKKLIYFVFDEQPVMDYYLIGGLTEINTVLLTEGYTKTGQPNPVVWLEIYDLETKEKITVDVGQKEKDQYIYNMRFTPDGNEFLFNRTDRYQRDLDVVALDYNTGYIRIVVSVHQDTWQENNPAMRFLEDGKRFIWETEKTMFSQYELRHLDGSLITTLTIGEYPARRIVEVDEENGYLYYMACSGEFPLNEYLHRVKLDGSNQEKLTTLPYHHSRVILSPNGKFFSVQYETIGTPKSSALYSSDGKLVHKIAEAVFLKNPCSELFTFKANDGITDIYGVLHKPEDFDQNKKYPVIVTVYGGPDSRAVYNSFQDGSSLNDEGYLVVEVDNRGTSGRGKAFKALVYGKMGDVDIQDQADAIRYLSKRSYIDATRVGIVGYSYGGYMAAMGVLKHPDVFKAAVDRAGPTQWLNYDSIWSERYMNLPDDNPEGYKKSNCMNYVDNLVGHLYIMHGMVDDNVHPNNAWQLIDALDKAGKRYESRFFPKGTHGFNGTDTQKEFFTRYLLNE